MHVGTLSISMLRSLKIFHINNIVSLKICFRSRLVLDQSSARHLDHLPRMNDPIYV